MIRRLKIIERDEFFTGLIRVAMAAGNVPAVFIWKGERIMGMVKKNDIDGKEVLFKASVAVTRL